MLRTLPPVARLLPRRSAGGVGDTVAAVWSRPSSSPYTTAAPGLDGLIITPAATRRLQDIKSGKVPPTLLPDTVSDPSAVRLRIAVESGGCSGFQYAFELTDESPEDDDTLFEKDDCGVIVDEASLELVRGSTVDFAEDLIRAGFQLLNNPNSETGCGCGVSFAPKD